MSGINRFTRGRQLSRHVVFGGGEPIFRWLPHVFRWGKNLSICWLGTELVFLGERDQGRSVGGEPK